MSLPGEPFVVTVTITNRASGAVVDPTGLSAITRSPDGTRTTYVYGTDDELTKTSTGIYVLACTPPRSNSTSAVGEWWIEFVGTGANAFVANESQRVEPSRVL